VTARTEPALPAPFRSGPFVVRPEWVDENGHLNLAYYILLFDAATDALWREISLGPEFRFRNFGTFAAEAHTLYRAELFEAEVVTIASQLIDLDSKRLHLTHEMRRERDGVISAQQELMYLCVDLTTRRVSPWPASVSDRLQAALYAHAPMKTPDWVGRRVAMPMRAAPSPTASTPAAPA